MNMDTQHKALSMLHDFREEHVVKQEKQVKNEKMKSKVRKHHNSKSDEPDLQESAVLKKILAYQRKLLVSPTLLLCHVPSRPIVSYPVLFHLVPSYLVLSRPILPCSVLSRPVLFCPVPSFHVLSHPILSRPCPSLSGLSDESRNTFM